MAKRTLMGITVAVAVALGATGRERGGWPGDRTG